MSRCQVSLVTPCYNEEESLPTYFQRVAELRAELEKHDIEIEVVMVDDGSKDATWSLIQQHCSVTPGFKPYKHDQNGGFGKALQTGLRHAGGDVVVTIDADTNYDLRETPSMLACLDDGADVVTASPFVEGASWKYPAHRFVLSKGLVLLYRLALGPKVKPLSVYTCGFRAYRRETLDVVMPRSDDFLATAEMIVRALWADFAVVEMPSCVHDRDFGQSKMNKLKTTVRHLRFLSSIFLWRIRGNKRRDSTIFPIL